MSNLGSNELVYARTNLLLTLAEKGNGRVTPDELLAAVQGNQKLVLNILWIARRSGYVSVDQVREGRKIAYWEIKVTGEIPAAPAVEVSALNAKKGVKVKTAKPVKAKSASAVKTPKAKAEKSVEQIKAANLAKMKKLTAKLAAKKKAKTRKIGKLADEVEREFGSTGEVASSFNIDPSWDSVEGLDIQKLVA